MHFSIWSQIESITHQLNLFKFEEHAWDRLRDRRTEQEWTEQTEYSNVISHSAHWLLTTLDINCSSCGFVWTENDKKIHVNLNYITCEWHCSNSVGTSWATFSCNSPWSTVKIESVWRLLTFHLWNARYRYQCGTRILFPELSSAQQDNRESRCMIHLIEGITPMHNCTHALFFFSLGRFRDNEIDDNTLDLEEKWCWAVGARCRYMWRTHAR